MFRIMNACIKNKNLNIMPNKIVVIPILQDYPFGSSTQYNAPHTTVQAKKSLQYGLEPRFVMKEKIRMLKNLGFQHLVGVQSTSEEENQINLIFQYVPFSLATALTSLDPEIVEKIKKQSLDLAQNLANHYVDHEFKLVNMGLDKKNNLKYYLGFNFKIDRSLKKEETVEKYKAKVLNFFSKPKQVKEERSPSKSYKNEYYETMDTTWKISQNFDDSPIKVNSSGRLMKKSTTVLEQTPKLQSQYFSPRSKDSRFTFNCSKQIAIPTNQRMNYDQDNTSEVKVVKMQQLGSRINKLKNYMKQITGKTPTNTGGMVHLTVKIDENNSDNRIFQENKIMIAPNYTKLEKKIAQFRESKLFRSYNQKEILYSKNNQGYQVYTTQKFQDNTQKIRQGISPKAIQDQPEMAKSGQIMSGNQLKKASPLENKNVRVPAYLLQKKNPFFPSTQANNNKISLNSSKNKQENPKQKQYRKLATNGGYCQQFLCILQDEPGNMQCGSPSTNSLSNQQQYHFLSRQNSECRKQKLNQNMQTETESAVQIQNRVKKAIRNSIKLINGLKTRQTINGE